MKKAVFVIFLMGLVLFSCKNTQKAEQARFKPHKLVYVTQSPDSLLTSESVYYDKDKDLLFVSCINGKPTDKDSNGYISQVSLSGKIINLKWASGLNAPKGMGIHNNKLYVTDIDRVAIIDVNTGNLIKFVNVKGAKFLNDIAIDSAGNVYITDSQNNLIYMLQNDSIVGVWLDSLPVANGLYLDGDTLYVGLKNKLISVNIKTKQTRTIAEYKTPMIDGLKKVSDGFITSDWYGKTYFVDTKNDTVYTMLYFPKQNKNIADFEYIPEMNLLIIPTFFDNRVEFYKFQ